jgi:metal-responsive CopG/Arc/MetJ family transcriptional regulator
MQQSAYDPGRLRRLQRRTRRASVSLPEGVMEELQELADDQGRSLSNVMAFLLESHLLQLKQRR